MNFGSLAPYITSVAFIFTLAAASQIDLGSIRPIDNEPMRRAQLRMIHEIRERHSDDSELMDLCDKLEPQL
ncbi:MAG TPA: hypothetical protein V6C86_24305 [Oculatellaceae cyanobacterium]